MKKIYLLLLFFYLLFGQTFAQRYTTEVFTADQIKVSTDVQYGVNATILPMLFAGATEFLPEQLLMDVYEPDPTMDDRTDRPVVVVVHGGDALPMISNQACWGDKQDWITVTTAQKLARMGYVAIAPNYRLGWDPTTKNRDLFFDGLIDAGTRMQHDIKACVRYLRKTIAEDDNPYGIASEKFAAWGTASGAGTTIVIAAYVDLEELNTPSYFISDEEGNVFNTFNLQEAGDIDGTTVGINALGDTTNYVNHPDYSSKFQMTAMGVGTAIDPGSLDEGEPPMIMFGNPNSPVTQVDEGTLRLPTTNEAILTVQLSGGVIKEANEVGLNDIWINADLDDPYTNAQRADPNFGEYEGWLPLYGPVENEYPWVWWDPNCPVNEQSEAALPNPDQARSLRQLDTMAAYFGVRAVVALQLDTETTIEDHLTLANAWDVYPNPATNALQIKLHNGQAIEEVNIFNLTGQAVQQYQGNQNTSFQINDLKLSTGLYVLQIRTNEGLILSSKLTIQ